MSTTATAMVVVPAGFAALVGAARVARRLFRPDPELLRKGVHAAMALLVLPFPRLFHSPEPVWALAAVFAAVLTMLKFSPSLHERFGDVLDGRKRATVGEILFPVGVAAAFHIAGGSSTMFCLPIAILALADPAAAIIGMRFGRRQFRVFGSGKSVEGSAAFFAVSALCGLVALPLLAGTGAAATTVMALGLAALLTVVEAVSGRGSDNLTVPAVGAIALRLMVG
jgi:phytol kinase